METDSCLAEELLVATVSRNLRKVDELMQCGIDPSLITNDGTSAFHAAVVLESPMGPKIVSRMLSYGANPNVKTSTGLSPLHIAAMWGRVDTINVLLDHGADIAIKDEDDMSALDYAEEAEENKEKSIDALTKFRPIIKQNLTSTGYHGDTSSVSNEHIEEDGDETFWSVWSTPPHRLSSKESPITFRKKSNSKHKRTPRGRAGSDLFIPQHEHLKQSTEETSADSKHEDDELIVNLTNLLIEAEEEILNISAPIPINTVVDNEATIDYSSTNNVSELVEYYEQKEEDETAKFFKNCDKSAFFDIVNLKNKENDATNHVNESLLDYSGVTVDYDWMDVSQLNPSESMNGVTISIPQAILTLSNDELRMQLKEFGENPGPISQSTKIIYQKHLAKLRKHEEVLKPGERFHDYTPEMRQILLGLSKQTKQVNEDLEVEMAYVFESPDKHTWREGTMKTSFNYILLDPRVTKNLPVRADGLKFEEQLKVFAAATFYIGKGKKSRPYEHFHEALKYEKSDKSKPASMKVKMIDEIWEAGLGIASVHIFHSIIPVEAYTREACMLEAMGLSRLTNVKYGDYYGPASTWNTKKKRLLGVYLLTKAMKIYLIEGERQIRRKDLSK